MDKERLRDHFGSKKRGGHLKFTKVLDFFLLLNEKLLVTVSS